MPMYEYECPKCYKVFEDYFSLSSDSSYSICPKCSSKSPKIISSPAVHIFKPHYNIGLGEYVETKQEMETIAKARNLTPV